MRTVHGPGATSQTSSRSSALIKLLLPAFTSPTITSNAAAWRFVRRARRIWTASMSAHLSTSHNARWSKPRSVSNCSFNSGLRIRAVISRFSAPVSGCNCSNWLMRRPSYQPNSLARSLTKPFRARQAKVLTDAQMNSEVKIPAGAATLEGSLTLPHGATVLVLFVHGSGSSRHSPRNQFVARTLNAAGLATLLFDLLTPEEEAVDMRTAQHRFDISLLAERLVHATHWAMEQESTRDLRLGYFGSSTGGGAALVAAAEQPRDVGAIVSRGGRPDLAGDALPLVQAPTLLIVGGYDDVVIDLNQQARARM